MKNIFFVLLITLTISNYGNSDCFTNYGVNLHKTYGESIVEPCLQQKHAALKKYSKFVENAINKSFPIYQQILQSNADNINFTTNTYSKEESKQKLYIPLYSNLNKLISKNHIKPLIENINALLVVANEQNYQQVLNNIAKLLADDVTISKILQLLNNDLFKKMILQPSHQLQISGKKLLAMVNSDETLANKEDKLVTFIEDLLEIFSAMQCPSLLQDFKNDAMLSDSAAERRFTDKINQMDWGNYFHLTEILLASSKRYPWGYGCSKQQSEAISNNFYVLKLILDSGFYKQLLKQNKIIVQHELLEQIFTLIKIINNIKKDLPLQDIINLTIIISQISNDFDTKFINSLTELPSSKIDHYFASSIIQIAKYFIGDVDLDHEQRPIIAMINLFTALIMLDENNNCKNIQFRLPKADLIMKSLQDFKHKLHNLIYEE